MEENAEESWSLQAARTSLRVTARYEICRNRRPNDLVPDVHVGRRHRVNRRENRRFRLDSLLLPRSSKRFTYYIALARRENKSGLEKRKKKYNRMERVGNLHVHGSFVEIDERARPLERDESPSAGRIRLLNFNSSRYTVKFLPTPMELPLPDRAPHSAHFASDRFEF